MVAPEAQSTACAVLARLILSLGLLVLLAVPPCAAGYDPQLPRAIELLKNRQPRLAVPLLEDLARRHPSDKQFQALLGEAYLGGGAELLGNGDDRSALEAFTSARSYLSDDYRPLQGMAVAWLMAGQPEAAVALLHEAEVLVGPRSELSLLIGRAYHAMGELTLAGEAWESAARAGAVEAAPLLTKLRREQQAEEGMTRRFGGRFRLSYAPGVSDALAGEILSVLQEAYQDLGREFSSYPDTEVPVLLYPRQQFAEVTGLPAWAGGAYDGKIRVPLGGIERMSPQLKAVLYHEYCHVLVRFLARDRAPAWLNEGLAQIAEERYHPHLARKVPGVTLPVGTLERSFAGLSADQAATAYALSYDRVVRLRELCGSPALAELLRQVGLGNSWSAAVEHAFAPCGYDWQSLEEILDQG